MKKTLMKNKAITLIALVITIIILLILAGITISQLSGSGIFEKAKEARDKWQNAQNEEEMQIAKYTNDINSYVDATRGSVTLTDEEYNLFKSQFSKNGNVLISKPNTWTVGTEYNFGDGVYGQRFTGEITATANTGVHELLTEDWQITYTIVDAGGSYVIGTNTNPWVGWVPLMSSNSSYYHLISYNTGTPIKGLDFLTKTDMLRTNAPYDIWILYTK